MLHSEIQDLSFPCEVSATPFTSNGRKWLFVPQNEQWASGRTHLWSVSLARHLYSRHEQPSDLGKRC